MAQRNSGYNRREADSYPTPAWVTRALLPHIPNRVLTIWEPAAGEGAMVRVLGERQVGRRNTGVIATDIRPGDGAVVSDLSWNFLAQMDAPNRNFQAIVTNPPFQLAQQFIERALELTRPDRGFVAMLLRTDFDHAKCRTHLFANCAEFSGKLVLTKRVVWFVDPLTGKPKAAPSENHAWFYWDHTQRGPATIAYYVEESLGNQDRRQIHNQNGQDRQDPRREGSQEDPGQAGCNLQSQGL